MMLYVGWGFREGTIRLAWLSSCFHFPCYPQADCALSGVGSWVIGLVYVLRPCGPLQQTLPWGWYSPAIATPAGFYSQRFWGFISPCWNPELHGLSCSPLSLPVYLLMNVRYPGLPAMVLPTRSASHRLVVQPLHPSFSFPPLLPVWMNVSSLTPWLLDFHTVWFSGSSGCSLLLNGLLSFFWLCEEVKHIYLPLHLGWKPQQIILMLCFLPRVYRSNNAFVIKLDKEPNIHVYFLWCP